MKDVKGKKLVWDYDDESNIDSSKLKDNNLHIDNIWNMKDTVECIKKQITK